VFDKNSVRLIQRTTHAAAAKDVMRGWLTALSAIMGRSAHNKIMYAALAAARSRCFQFVCVCFYGRHHRRPVKNRQRKSVHAERDNYSAHTGMKINAKRSPVRPTKSH
jgi:hypothetical protein